MDLSSSSKRAKALNVNQSCLVDGCESDLSQSREYHRRHKVCEPHSKTPRVTIAGRHQRFCQQCSRFHSLEEFDEGKRSCRKRLDGHNRRRRKPPLSVSDALPRSSSGSGILYSTPQGTRVVSLGGGPHIYGNPVSSSSSSSSSSSVSGSGRVVKAENESWLVFHNNSPQYPISSGSGLGLFNQEGSMFLSEGGVGALSLLSSSSSGTASPVTRDMGGGFMHYGTHPFFPPHHHHHFSHGQILPVSVSTQVDNGVSSRNPNSTTHNTNANSFTNTIFRDNNNNNNNNSNDGSSASGATHSHQTRSFGW